MADLVTTTMRISNTRDYPVEMMEALIKTQTPEHFIERAGWTHFYVVEDEGRLIGCGAIGPLRERRDESCLFSIFVHPQSQGMGIGRRIIGALETDSFFLRAKRIEIPASITGLPFYLKMGYRYKDGIVEPDENGLVRLEKRRSVQGN